MSTALRTPRMSREEFFAWAEVQHARYEFDGFQPVAMTGGNLNHSRIMRNLHAALRARLRGTGCEPLGPDAGVATIGDAVRYPDALVTCTKAPGLAHTVPGVVVVFEILSPTSGRIDRIVKVREYAAVPSVRRYIILEQASVDVTVLARDAGETQWRAGTLTGTDILPIPEVGTEIPIAEFYEDVDLSAAEGEQ